MYLTLESGVYYVQDEMDLIYFLWAKDYRPDRMYLWLSQIYGQFLDRA